MLEATELPTEPKTLQSYKFLNLYHSCFFDISGFVAQGKPATC